MAHAIPIGPCSAIGCGKPIESKYWCRKHYQKYYKGHQTYNKFEGNKRNHPFYMLWFERKQVNLLCDDWLNFKNFVIGVSPKPEGNYFLVRITDEKLSPENFKWQEHLRKRDNETNKQWYARKWASRQAAYPGMERSRNYKRKYNLTIEEFDEKVKLQNNKCAICKNEETGIDGKSGTRKRLAVDHCHATNKIRELLCWTCNSIIGRVNEDTKLLQAMIDYLNKHKDY